MATTRELMLPDGRRLVVHDAPVLDDREDLTLIWHHGSPQTGALFEPLLSLATARRVRLVAYARPGYGGSSATSGRDVASAAADVEQVADALGIGRFATMGASGGGPHALACAGVLGERVIGVVAVASPAPYTEDFDWYAGMVAPEALQAAAAGRDARARFAETEEFDERSFIAADWAVLAGAWVALGRDAAQAGSEGPDGMIDDDVAFAAPWGFDVAGIRRPVLLVHGEADRVVPVSHGHALLRTIETAELWLRPRDGHISVLGACSVAMDWLLTTAGIR